MAMAMAMAIVWDALIGRTHAIVTADITRKAMATVGVVLVPDVSVIMISTTMIISK